MGSPEEGQGDDEKIASRLQDEPSANRLMSILNPDTSNTTRRRCSRNKPAAMMESTKQTEQEMNLKRLVKDEGTPVDHTLALDTSEEETGESRDGIQRRSREKTVFVDLGDGPEEVVMIDWAEGDPEVSFILHPLLYIYLSPRGGAEFR